MRFRPGPLALIVILLCTAMLAYAAHLFLFHSIYDGGAEWRSELIESSLNCAAWLLVAPLFFAAGARVPFTRARWPGAIAFHVPASLIASLLQVSLHAVMKSITAQQGLYSGDAAATFGHLLARTYSFGVVAYWIVLVSGQVIDERRQRERARLRLEGDLARARLRHLQSQLAPHFLFNTLHAIAALVEEQPQKAQEMIAYLGDLLRESLEMEETQEVPLRDELRFLDLYMAIEQIRFSDRLTIARKVDNDALDGLVPTLLLQPLVENAIRHGFMSRRGAGRIDIEATRDDGILRLTVRDDGPGIAEPEIALRRGRGARNAAERLEHLYGSRQSFLYRNVSPHGAEVTIVLPYHTRS